MRPMTKLYPNPNNDRFNISAKNREADLIGKRIRLDAGNTLGQSVYHTGLRPSSSEWKTQIDPETELAIGRYMLQLSSLDGAFRSTLQFVLSR